MPDPKLIHKSRKYADKISAHIPLDRLSEDYIREIVFQCWLDAYAAGLLRGLDTPPHKEDMGR